jgi:hypothetical protein
VKIEVHLSIGYPSAEHDEEIEVPDDATELDIEQAVAEWAGEYIETWWERVEEEKPRPRRRKR